MNPIVHAVFVGGPKVLHDERGELISSIARTRAQGAVHLAVAGLEGDHVAQSYHGGLDAAVCVHLCDHYQFWRDQYGIDLPPGYVGENLVLDGIAESEVCAGDKIRIGSALVQISGPRVPCSNQARRAGRPDWVKLTIQESRTRFYLRVLEPGVLGEGDAWVLEERIDRAESIVAINRCMYVAFDRQRAEAIAQIPGLADWWKKQLRAKVRQRNEHWSDTITE